MSKFTNIDDALRNSFDNYEVPFDAAQWGAMESKLDNATGADLSSFDKKIKDSLTGHQVAYNPAAWTAVESQLVASTVSYTKWFIAAGVVGALSLGYYLFSGDDATVVEKEKKEQPENLTANNNSKKKEDKAVVSDQASDELKFNDSSLKLPNEEKNNTGTVHAVAPNPYVYPAVINSVDPKTHIANTGHQNLNEVIDPVIPVQSVRSFSAPVINGATEVCQGVDLKLASSEISSDITSQWYLNGVLVSEEAEINLKNLTNGTHEVELVHSASKNPELYEQPIRKSSKTIVVKESPSVDFSYVQIGDASYPEMKLSVLGPEEGVNYVWMMDNKSYTGNEIMYLFKDKGIYPVQLLAETSNGCSKIETKNIEISNDFNLLAPIAFTPNADGHNDAFIPEALKVLNLSFRMNVYDRQQGLVYQTNRVDAPWDGRNMNSGDFCNQGAYRWVVELTTKDGKVEFYQGTITILK